MLGVPAQPGVEQKDAYGDYLGGTRTVDVHVRRLRSKIESPGRTGFIETIYQVGYRFKAPD